MGIKQVLSLRPDTLTDYFENAPIGVQWLNQEGIILYANGAQLALLGYSKDEYIGHAITEFYADEPAGSSDISKRPANDQDVLSGRYEVRMKCKDGTIKTVQIQWDDYRQEGRFIHTRCFIQDVTTERQIHQLLQESENRYKIILEASNDGQYDWDLTKNVVYWNDKYYEMLGLEDTKPEPTFEFFTSLIHEDDRERIIQEIQMSLKTPDYHVMEYRLRHRDGTYRHILCRGKTLVDDTGTPMHISGLVRDITERKLAELAIKESEERFRTMADAAPVMIWTTDASGNDTYFNKTWLEFTGRSLDEELSGAWRHAIHPEDADYAYNTCMSAKKREEGFVMEFRFRRQDGEYRWILDTATPRFTSNGEFAGYIGSCVDITDIRQLAEQMKAAKEVAEEANHRKSQFLAAMSHEFRTPLNAIIGYSQMLQNGYSGDLNDKQLKYITNVTASGKHLLDMVNEILDLAKIESGKTELVLETINLHDLMEEKQAIFQPMAAKKHINWDMHIAPELTEITADPQRLRQILMNLLSNAIKFNREGGQVSIRWTTENAQWAVCEVEDTGSGIPADSLPHLFSEFYQVDNSFSRQHEGTGLGLCVTRQLVELHGGDIWVKSEVGVGSSFGFRIPLRKGDS